MEVEVASPVQLNVYTESASGSTAEMSPDSAAIEMALPEALEALNADDAKAPEAPRDNESQRSVPVRAHMLCMLACVALQTAALALGHWPTPGNWNQCNYGLARPERTKQTAEAFGIIAGLCGAVGLVVLAADTVAKRGLVPGYPAARRAIQRAPAILWGSAAVSSFVAVVVWPAFFASDKPRQLWYEERLDGTWLGLQVAATCLSLVCCLCFARALRRFVTPSLLLAALVLEVSLLSVVHWGRADRGHARAQTASEALGVCAAVTAGTGLLATALGALSAEGLIDKSWDFCGRHRVVAGLLCSVTALFGLSATASWSGAWRHTNHDLQFTYAQEQATWLALQTASAVAAVGAGLFCVPYNHWRHYLVPLALLAFAALQVSALAVNTKWPTTGEVARKCASGSEACTVLCETHSPTCVWTAQKTRSYDGMWMRLQASAAAAVGLSAALRVPLANCRRYVVTLCLLVFLALQVTALVLGSDVWPTPLAAKKACRNGYNHVDYDGNFYNRAPDLGCIEA
eukprot:m51a1_g7799 hypothetical protein (517) ;mRNA; f:57075-59706